MTGSLAPMRKLTIPPKAIPVSSSRSSAARISRPLIERGSISALQTHQPTRSLAQVRSEPLSELWFTPSKPARTPLDDVLGQNGQLGSPGDHKPPDERTLKLGKTLQTLSPLLPTILTQPLPPSLLSPSISLHLFPSTHPHLPAVKGKVAYRAALWTAPVAWGSVPIVGNVKLEIRSEKMVRTGYISGARNDSGSPRSGLGEEKLVVRWETATRKNGNDKTATLSPASSSQSSPTLSSPSSSSTSTNSTLSTLLGGPRPILPTLSTTTPFSGMFIFTFDSEGRIATHTIEHADECSGTDRTSRMVTLTDWLLGRAKRGVGSEEGGGMIPGLAMVRRVREGVWVEMNRRR